MSFAKLDAQRIIDEALALMNEDGLAKVSLRKIAGRLNVDVSSLYWHIPSRQALFGLMATTVFRSCLASIPKVADWQEWLRAFGGVLWEAQNEITDARALIAIADIGEDVTAHVREELVAILQDLGLDPGLAEHAQRSVQALVTGWTTLQSRTTDGHSFERASFDLALNALIQGWACKEAWQSIKAGYSDQTADP